MKHLKQFVPSSVCLKCDGCCRFKSADSAWRPKDSQKEFTDDQNFITTIQDCGNHLCRFFNKSDSTCRVYDQRPFECALYPFVLSRAVQGVRVYVHLACPHIQETQASPALGEYVDYLKEFFCGDKTRNFLANNAFLIHDYSPFAMELQHLFTIEGLRL